MIHDSMKANQSNFRVCEESFRMVAYMVTNSINIIQLTARLVVNSDDCQCLPGHLHNFELICLDW